MNPFIVLSILLPSLLFALQFTQAPTFTSTGGGQWQIAFAVDQNADVEVSIVNTQDSTVVRHLAAGLLGATPPTPFTANSLSQTLTWDGKNDFGQTVANPQALKARVRAGMYPVLKKFAAEHLYDQGGSATSVTDAQGNNYILSNGSGQSPFLRKYDASGNYVKTLFPPPPHLPADSVKSYKILVLPGGKWVPVTRQVNGNGVQFGQLVMKGATITGLVAGKIRISTKVSGTHYIDTSGNFTDTLPNNLAKAAGGLEATSAPRLLKAQAEFREGPFVMERVAVDRVKDRVFWNGGNYISDWKNPVIRQLPMILDNITVGPKGHLYGWNQDGSSGYAFSFIKRYNGTTFTPANYGNTGNNQATGNIYYEFGWAGTPGNHRGVAVSWQGQIASFPENSPVFQVADSGGNASWSRGNTAMSGNAKALITVPNYTGETGAWSQTRQAFMGIKYDAAGNYYVGIRKISSPIVPAGFGMDPSFRNIGSVVKFQKDATGTFHSTLFTLTGHERIYRQPYGPFTMLSSGGWDQLGDMACTCRGSYFDVDPYGRIYVPNGVTNQVYIADNAGNNLAVFGEYGNTDCRGGLSGPGEVKSTPAFPFAWPTSVGASEDFVYVADLVNARLAQVQMAYQIDNFPGLTSRGLGAVAANRALKASTSLSSAPNPFTPESQIRVNLPSASRISLKVLDLNGRLVRTLASANFPAGVRHFLWNAKDDAGRSVSAGMYVYRLDAADGVMFSRTLLVK